MKILLVRFSSIGDIVLTTPVIRALKQQVDSVEIHFLTKESFQAIVAPNPHISKVFTIQKSIDEVIPALQAERYDWVIDLHNNVRTKSLKVKLGRPYKAFPKLNVKKWQLVKLKVNRMPKIHVVARYFKAVEHLGVQPDGLPGDFFIEAENEVQTADWSLKPKGFICFAIGAQFATKRLPTQKIIAIIAKIQQPVVLVGGPTDCEVAEEISQALPEKVINTCGKLNLQQSASLVKQSAHLITHDTGMMHIASCFSIPMTTVWGNTVTDFGMYPYTPSNPNLYSVHQVENLSCRPCSKIGYASCPKKHFKCMNDQDVAKIAGRANPSRSSEV